MIVLVLTAIWKIDSQNYIKMIVNLPQRDRNFLLIKRC